MNWIHEAIAKPMAKNMENRKPIDTEKRIVTDKEIDHFFECKIMPKSKCPKCVDIVNRRMA